MNFLNEITLRYPGAISFAPGRPYDGFFAAGDAALTRSAEQFGVIWTPMRYFHPDDGGRQAIRLSVSYLSPEEIDEGITRLVAFIEAETSRRDPEP